MKVHITLKSDVARDAEKRAEARRRIVAACGLAVTNEKRFERHGILTGDVDAARLDALRGLDVVASVEPDAPKRAL